MGRAGGALKIDAGYRCEHVLADGTRVTLRLIRPEDGGELRRAFERLSPASRYRRFLAGVSQLSDEMVHYLTEVDGVNHLAVVATTDSYDLKTEVGLGIARFIRLEEDPTVAEAAVTVIDDAQGKGIGKLLLGALAEAARERGIHTFRGEVLASNEPMRRMLGELGAVVREDDGTSISFDVALDHHHDEGDEGESAVPSERSDHPLWQLLRAVAASLASLGDLGRPEDEEKEGDKKEEESA